MKALTVCNPHAHFIAIGEKPIENRSRLTHYRGELLIHAGLSRAWLREGDEQRYPNMAYGAFVALVTLVACLDVTQQWTEEWAHLRSHKHTHGPCCLVLENVRRLPRPIPHRGYQGLWNVPDSVVVQVRYQLNLSL